MTAFNLSGNSYLVWLEGQRQLTELFCVILIDFKGLNGIRGMGNCIGEKTEI